MQCTWCDADGAFAMRVIGKAYHWHCLKRRMEMLRWHCDHVQENARETRELTALVIRYLRQVGRA